MGSGSKRCQRLHGCPLIRCPIPWNGTHKVCRPKSCVFMGEELREHKKSKLWWYIDKRSDQRTSKTNKKKHMMSVHHVARPQFWLIGRKYTRQKGKAVSITVLSSTSSRYLKSAAEDSPSSTAVIPPNTQRGGGEHLMRVGTNKQKGPFIQKPMAYRTHDMLACFLLGPPTEPFCSHKYLAETTTGRRQLLQFATWTGSSFGTSSTVIDR